jgi:hypothetical protein
MKKILQQALPNTAIRLILAAQTVIALAWLGDIVKEGPSSRIYFLQDFPWFVNILFAALVIFICTSLFVMLQKMHKKVNYRRINITVKPHKAIIFFVSKHTIQQKFLDNCIQTIGNQPDNPGNTKELIFTKDINKDIENLQSLRIPYQQILRGIVPHSKSLQNIVFIAFDDETRKYADAYSVYINKYFNNNIKIHTPSHDMNLLGNIENIQAIETAVKHAISLLIKSGLKNQDVMIDITGGTKPASIAGVLATVDMPELEFQYVSSNDPFNITSFDLLNTSDADSPY